MRLARRTLGAIVLCGMALVFGPAVAAGNKAIAYASPSPSSIGAYLVDWQGQTRAHVVAALGNRDGSVTNNGSSQRVITLDSPLTIQYAADYVDCDGIQPLLQQDTLQIAVKTTSGSDTRGTSAIVELGTITTLDGCDAGHVEQFGSLTDPGLAVNTIAMNARPPVSDLVPGVAIAGPSETTDPNQFPVADILLLQAGGLGQFLGSGHVVPAAFDADHWLQLPSLQRAYTRVIVDRRSGAEIWLVADWASGQAQNLSSTLMVKPAPGAGFGNVRRASRQWLSGLASTETNTFSIYLYQNGTGERVSVDLITGIETRTPITSWVFSGQNIQQTRPAGSNTRVRTWVPLANGGGRTRFVMESEDLVQPDGTHSPGIVPRVNVYTDTGAATPPTASARR